MRIQLEDLERWRRGWSQVHERRLREYRQRLAGDEAMNVAIRREERDLQNLEQAYEDEPQDSLTVAVPLSPKFRQLADKWRTAPLVQRCGIGIVLVGRDGTVEGLDLP